MNLTELLENAARKFPDKAAMVMDERRVSFRQLEEDSNRIANALKKMGVQKGDRVAMLQGSNPEFATVFFGIQKTGAIAVPLDSRYVPDELDRIFSDCRPKVLAAENPPLEALLPSLARFSTIKHVISIEPAFEDRFTSFNKIMAESPAASVKQDIAPDDIAIISYTGGATHTAHGVMLSHRSVVTEAMNSAEVFGQTDKDVLMAFALPMYHQFGLTAVLMASVYTGSTIVIVPGTGRSIDSFMESVEREKGTLYMGVPYIFALMINVARREGVKHDLSSLRACIAGGAPLPLEIIDLFKQYYGFTIRDIYGQTETVSQATVMPIDGRGTPGASGLPMPCWEIKIFDENGNELPAGQEGEIVARGPVTSGIYNNPEATSRLIKKGWLYTCDIGRIDEDGFLYITARRRRMLILKGQNIFPDDIEEVLETHPKVAKVIVAGVPDVIRGETVKALIQLKPGETATEQEIRQYCQGRMADYKLPREIVFVDAVPESVPNWRRPAGTEVPDLTQEGKG